MKGILEKYKKVNKSVFINTILMRGILFEVSKQRQKCSHKHYINEGYFFITLLNLLYE